MNSFDIAVYLGLIIAVVTGFNTGLLRSALTILAYLFAMPIAPWVMSVISPRLDPGSTSPLSQSWPLFFGIFLVSGMALGKLARMASTRPLATRPASLTAWAAPHSARSASAWSPRPLS
jgi:membrane protein required for colicin V production